MLPTRYGHTEFYSVAAQVIPVLLLAIVFEQRLFRRRDIPLIVAATLSPIVIGAFVAPRPSRCAFSIEATHTDKTKSS